MNDQVAARPYQRYAQAFGASGKQNRAPLRNNQQAFDWFKEKRSFREALLYWRDFGSSLYSSLTKPRLPQSYYAFIENLDLSRGQAIFLIVMVLVSGRVSFKITTTLMDSMPEVDLIAHAQAGETIQSNKYRKTDKDGFFLEDCY